MMCSAAVIAIYGVDARGIMALCCIDTAAKERMQDEGEQHRYSQPGYRMSRCSIHLLVHKNIRNVL